MRGNVCVSDMKRGMIDVGIFCKEPRFSLNTEKGERFTAIWDAHLDLNLSRVSSGLGLRSVVLNLNALFSILLNELLKIKLE